MTRIDYVYKICTKQEWDSLKQKNPGMDQKVILKMVLFIFLIKNKLIRL